MSRGFGTIQTKRSKNIKEKVPTPPTPYTGEDTPIYSARGGCRTLYCLKDSLYIVHWCLDVFFFTSPVKIKIKIR